MRLTPSMMKRPMIPMPTGRNATTTRIAMFQETTAGPDSHTKWSTGGTFLSARTRSDQALPELGAEPAGRSRESTVGFALFMVEDMIPSGPRCVYAEIWQGREALESCTKAMRTLIRG